MFPSKSKGAYIYLIKNKDTGHMKIGIAKDIKQRLKALQTGSVSELEVLSLIYSETPYTLEKNLHNRFASKRLRGEWFNLEGSDIEYIMKLSTDDFLLFLANKKKDD